MSLRDQQIPNLPEVPPSQEATRSTKTFPNPCWRAVRQPEWDCCGEIGIRRQSPLHDQRLVTVCLACSEPGRPRAEGVTRRAPKRATMNQVHWCWRRTPWSARLLGMTPGSSALTELPPCPGGRMLVGLAMAAGPVALRQPRRRTGVEKATAWLRDMSDGAGDGICAFPG